MLTIERVICIAYLLDIQLAMHYSTVYSICSRDFVTMCSQEGETEGNLVHPADHGLSLRTSMLPHILLSKCIELLQVVMNQVQAY